MYRKWSELANSCFSKMNPRANEFYFLFSNLFYKEEYLFRLQYDLLRIQWSTKVSRKLFSHCVAKNYSKKSKHWCPLPYFCSFSRCTASVFQIYSSLRLSKQTEKLTVRKFLNPTVHVPKSLWDLNLVIGSFESPFFIKVFGRSGDE